MRTLARDVEGAEERCHDGCSLTKQVPRGELLKEDVEEHSKLTAY